MIRAANGVAIESHDAVKLGEIERQSITQALHEHAFNRTEIARALGISRRALIDKLRRYCELGFPVDAPSSDAPTFYASN